MITLQDNAVEPASRSELISHSPVLLLAPGEPRAPIAILSPARPAMAESLRIVHRTIARITGIAIGGIRWLRSYVWRNVGHIAAGALLIVILGWISSLYLPTITSNFGRVQFSVRTDCSLSPSAITINLVDPPDAFVSIAFEGFERGECSRIELRDETDVFKLVERGFIEQVMYSDHLHENVGIGSFEHSRFHVAITKERVAALHMGAASDKKRNTGPITLDFVAPHALTRTGHSRSALPVFPAIVRQDGHEPVDTRVIIRAPAGYVFSSSVPIEPRILLSRSDGVLEAWFELPAKSPGFLVYLEDARGGALRELLIFIASGIFGYLSGFLLQSVLERRALPGDRRE